MPAHTPEEIHALLAAAMTTGDLDAFTALHEDDATAVIPPDGLQVTGKDAIREAVAATFALNPAADIEVLGKVEGGELALTHARWRLTPAEGGELSGRGTIVSRRQPDGTWRIVLDNPMTPA